MGGMVPNSLVLVLVLVAMFSSCQDIEVPGTHRTSNAGGNVHANVEASLVEELGEALPRLSGMFLKVESTYSGCRYALSEKDWIEEFRSMARLGVSYVVLQNTITSDTNGRRLYPSVTNNSTFQPSTCPQGEMQVPFILNAAQAHGIGVWLGGIWHHYETGEYFRENLKDLYFPDRGNQFQNHPAYRGIYLSIEQTLTPRMEHRPYQAAVTVANEVFRQTGKLPSYAVSPTYFSFDYPQIKNIPTGCSKFARSPTIAVAEAKGSMEQLLRRVPDLDLVMVQDKTGFQYVGPFNVSNYFGKTVGFGAASNLRSADQLAWNLEAFHLEGSTCENLKITTAPWSKVRRALIEAKEAGVSNIISYEWFTNWSPRFITSGGPSLYADYLREK